MHKYDSQCAISQRNDNFKCFVFRLESLNDRIIRRYRKMCIVNERFWLKVVAVFETGKAVVVDYLSYYRNS